MSRNTNLDLPFFRPFLGRREISAVRRVMRRGWLTTGAETAAFEEEFAEYLHSRSTDREGAPPQTVAVNSATAGLHLALEALGIGPGDRVAVPTLTFTAAAEVLRLLGADPVFIDSEQNTGNLDPQGLFEVREKISAAIPVHLAGHPCDMDAMRRALSGTGVPIIEDAAHAFPARTAEGMAGTLGDAAVFSFYATKTITTGEGGMAVCRNEKVADRMRLMRLHGIDRTVWNRYTEGAGERSWEYDVVAPGFKYNMTDIAASIGRVQLGRADWLALARRELAGRYRAALAGLPNIELPPDHPGHAWHLFIIRVGGAAIRDRLAAALHRAGIGSSVHFIPLHRMTYWRKTYSLDPGTFPVAEALADRILSLPLWPGMRPKDQRRVIEAVRGVVDG